MKPKIKDDLAWQQAEILMQPTLIRVLDNIRKQVENSVWEASYQETQLPYPGYQLNLTHETQTVSVDVWDLCYQVCFLSYEPTHGAAESREVEIDTHLINNENGEVDWNRLDDKARHIVGQLFSSLAKS